MLAITAPIALMTLALAVQTGRDLEIPAIQIATIVIGSIVVWRLGPQIVEGMTRIYEEATGRDQGRQMRRAQKNRAEENLRYCDDLQQGTVPDSSLGSNVFCVHCGYAIPAYATFCRRCGRRQ